MSRTELLVTGLVVGVMGVVAGVAVMTARTHTRDVTRIAQIREIQMGLELHFQGASAYPIASEPLALGTALTACLSADGFSAPCGEGSASTYLASVPTPPDAGLDELSSCGGAANAFCYSATSDAYRVTFELERANAALGLTKGLNCATEDDVKPGACEALSSGE